MEAGFLTFIPLAVTQQPDEGGHAWGLRPTPADPFADPSPSPTPTPSLAPVVGVRLFDSPDVKPQKALHAFIAAVARRLARSAVSPSTNCCDAATGSAGWALFQHRAVCFSELHFPGLRVPCFSFHKASVIQQSFHYSAKFPVFNNVSGIQHRSSHVF